MTLGRPLRVVHVSQPVDAGVARCVVDLATQQVATGLSVTVLCPDGWLATAARSVGAEVMTWSARRSPGPWTVLEALRLRLLLRRLEPDLVHLHSAKAGLAGRLVVRGRRPTVFQPHGWSFLAARGLVRFLAVRWERLALAWTARVVCVGEDERRLAEDAGPAFAGRIAVVPNGVDLARFRSGDREQARRELGLPDGPLAVCVGRLCQQKGQDLLLEAWEGVRQAVPGAVLALVGDGPEEERLRSHHAEAVRFAGSAADPRPWYAAADVVVVPSRWEGMALVALEAAASGRSVVMTSVSGAEESVADRAGQIVPVDDRDALSAAIVARLADPRMANEEGRRGRRHAESRTALSETTSRMLTVYQETLTGTPSEEWSTGAAPSAGRDRTGPHPADAAVRE